MIRFARTLLHGVSGFSRTREWRQFRLLSRDSVRQLLNVAMMSRGSDPMLFALWVGVFILTPLTMYSVRILIRYSGAPSWEALEPLLLRDRMFFLLCGMFAAALIASLTWEALLPNQTDQEVLGALPVRPRTAAAARLIAAITTVIALSAALAIPSGVALTMASLASPAPWLFPLVAATHLIVMCGGPLCVFVVLLAIRALVALLFGTRGADRMALALQLATVIGLIEAFLYLPVVMPFLGQQMRGGEWGGLLPPVWFASLYAAIVGPAIDGAPALAARAMGALIVGLGCATVLYLAPARLLARRALESQSRQRAGRLATFARFTTRVLFLRPAVASLFEFTLASLSRNPRHLLVVAGYLGAGIALGAVSVITAELRGVLVPTPQAATLTFPLTVIFLLTLGFRSAFNIPTELPANWPLRLFPPRLRDVIAAVRLTIVLLGVMPVVAATLLLARVAGWTWGAALAVGTMNLLAGALLVEGVLYGWRKVPFSCARPPDVDAIRLRWLLVLIALNVFAARGADLQLIALQSFSGTVVYVAISMIAIAGVHIAGRREAGRLTIDFDGPPDTTMQALNLSEALR